MSGQLSAYQKWSKGQDFSNYAAGKGITAGQARSELWAQYKAAHKVVSIKRGPRASSSSRSRSRSASVAPRSRSRSSSSYRASTREQLLARKDTKYGRDKATGRALTSKGNVRKARRAKADLKESRAARTRAPTPLNDLWGVLRANAKLSKSGETVGQSWDYIYGRIEDISGRRYDSLSPDEKQRYAGQVLASLSKDIADKGIPVSRRYRY